MIPKPSNSFRLQTHFQFTKLRPFPALWIPLQRILPLRESISVSTHLGKKGNKLEWQLKPRWSWWSSSQESNFPFQPANFFCTLSISIVHSTFLRLPTARGNPRFWSYWMMDRVEFNLMNIAYPKLMYQDMLMKFPLNNWYSNYTSSEVPNHMNSVIST